METERTQSPATALFGKTRRLVMAFLFGRPEQSFFTREVSRATKVSVGAVQRELIRLARAGILTRTVRGNLVFYQANSTCPIFSDLRALMIKTEGIADLIRAGLTKLAGRISIAFLYGSLVHGPFISQSDVDILIVGELSFADVVAALAPIQDQLGRDVNPSVYPTAEFRRKLHEGHHFLTSVLREPKVFLVGNDHELDRLAHGGLAHGAPKQQTRNHRLARRRRS